MSVQDCLADMIVELKRDHPKAFAEFMRILLEKDETLHLTEVKREVK